MSRDRTVKVDGLRLIMRDPIHQQYQWQRGRWYEREMLYYIEDTYRGGVYIDGGACIGNHTLYFAAFCADEVIAVEPVSRNAKHLRDNVALNALRNVTVVEAALSAGLGRGAMRQLGQSHGEWILEDGDEVDVVTLDTLVEQVGRPVRLVKLDIEGGELDALRGARRLLTEHKPVLFVELKTPERQETAAAFLGTYGYERGKQFNHSPTWEFVA